MTLPSFNIICDETGRRVVDVNDSATVIPVTERSTIVTPPGLVVLPDEDGVPHMITACCRAIDGSSITMSQSCCFLPIMV
jgi:hypothetical protein